MSIEKIIKELGSVKEVTVDQRIEYMEQIEAIEDQIANAREVLGNIPDVEPEQGEQDPRDAFVDGLIAAAGDDKTNNGRNTRTVAVE